ncbi:Hypothetical predicted protein [Paramuricea clavata]|uniref:Uncharacterized protein n=1 Tax=Paramuricea clavata TaxID=317549 RepID=A0A7D9JFR1_PARCT|nr:Hypothetical predicted protein [Paramuricea clavata]
MSHFDQNMPTEIIVDASPVGLAALPVQAGKVISYASRVLSDIESRYSQTEREMLAVVWGGSRFQIITDHKPLLAIFKTQKPATPPMDRWKLRLMPYNCKLQYRPRKDNPADFLSRHPEPVNFINETENLADLYANYVCSNAIPKAITREAIKLETKLDPLLQKVATAISLNNWTHPTVERYHRFQD